VTTQIIVVEDLADWKFPALDNPVVQVDDYLTGRDYFQSRSMQVINLCRSYKYLSVGYYCSLLAEARRHRVNPSVKTILDVSSKAMYSLDVDALGESVQKVFTKYRKDSFETVFEMDVYFGKCRFEAMAELARQVFETLPCPLLRLSFRREGPRWRIESIKPLSLHRLEQENHAFFAEQLTSFLQKRWRAPRTPMQPAHDLAILYDRDDPLPPSDEKALQKFVKIGRSMDIDVDIIDRKDYSRLAEYDALFIRATTAIKSYTYRFAKKAESEGMVVIDDPRSILRCTNKVYLAELLRANKVPAPPTVIAGKNDLEAMEEIIGYPMVLKVPDGSFSRGVVKADDRQQMRVLAGDLLRTSELILAQAFLYTEFDWRIGVLARQPLFACQYFMSKKHWQILHHRADGSYQVGAWKTLPIEDVPPAVVEAALKAANLIGDGLYGVDVKQGQDGVYVIEVNDNPNLDAGVEDGVLKDELYRRILGEFVRRIAARGTARGG
jgi:glutathione synthase/RimK-type ligase-like ATP-grasp enzyme